MTRRNRVIYGMISVLVVLAMLGLVLFAPSFAPTSHGVIKQIKGNGGTFTDNATVARRLDVVFSEYPVGSFFSDTGKACTCHATCNYYDDCDCINTYYDPEKNGEEVRLYSSQCMAFSHYMFYKLFGFVDREWAYPQNVGKFYSLGSLSASQMTVENVKKLFQDVKTGANVRATNKHSFIVLSTDENGLYVYHANTGVACQVDCWYWTWEELTQKYKSVGIQYIHLPVDYPESEGTYVPPSETVPEYQGGQVRVNTGTAGLNLRSQPNTNSSVLTSIPHATLLDITQVAAGWGKTTYDDGQSAKTGWIHLGYTLPVLQVSLPEDRFYVYDGVSPDMTEMTVSWLNEDMTVKILKSSEYTVTYSAPVEGQYTVTVTVSDQIRSFSMVGLPRGDLDKDGALTAGDVTLLLQGISSDASFTPRQKEGADVDGNGTVDRNDAQAMMDYLTGKGLPPLPNKEG
ncbi:MAG: SH3 domain-containing protein [Clostridia bacterium]|nr:SH3 domain-containing protein [Clostridia bacterium]MBQ5743277.1 SH3 domain-containing protein [Clostridia bacterium]